MPLNMPLNQVQRVHEDEFLLFSLGGRRIFFPE